MTKFSSEVVSASLMGRRAIREYPFPGLDGVTVGVRVLSDEEIDEARLLAAEVCKQKAVDVTLDPEFLERLIHRCIIAKAFFDVEKTMDRFFSSQADVAKFDALVVRSLYELYASHVQDMDPLSFVPPEEVGALIAQLGKSETHAARLSLFDRRTLLSFVLSMAQLLRAK